MIEGKNADNYNIQSSVSAEFRVLHVSKAVETVSCICAQKKKFRRKLNFIKFLSVLT